MKKQIPGLPKIAKKGLISKTDGKRLLRWKKLFEKIDVLLVFEEDDFGWTYRDEGTMAQIILSATYTKTENSPPIYGYLNADNKAIISVEGYADWDDFYALLEEKQAPIDLGKKEGTWEEIYNLVVKYIDFRNKLVPELPVLN